MVYREYPHVAVSDPSGDEVSERIKSWTDNKNCLILTSWSVNGIHNLLDISKAIACDSTFFCDSVVPGLVEGI
jgi:hypothetical protein